MLRPQLQKRYAEPIMVRVSATCSAMSQFSSEQKTHIMIREMTTVSSQPVLNSYLGIK